MKRLQNHFRQELKVPFQDGHEEQRYTGDLSNFDFSKAWLADKCIPLIREITFENAEELTEEGVPFLILFKHPDDKTSEKAFSEAVMRDIPDKKGWFFFRTCQAFSSKSRRRQLPGG